MAQSSGWGVMVSHRSGETEDTFIADLVVGLCTGQVLCALIFLRFIIKMRNFILQLHTQVQIFDCFIFLILFRLKQEPRAVQSVWPNTTRSSGKLTVVSMRIKNIFCSKRMGINKRMYFISSASSHTELKRNWGIKLTLLGRTSEIH